MQQKGILKIRNKFIKAIRLDFDCSDMISITHTITTTHCKYERFRMFKEGTKQSIKFREIEDFIGTDIHLNKIGSQFKIGIRPTKLNKGGLLVDFGYYLVKNDDGLLKAYSPVDFHKKYDIIEEG